MSGHNGVAGSIGGGLMLDRRFGRYLVISDGDKDVAFDLTLFAFCATGMANLGGAIPTPATLIVLREVNAPPIPVLTRGVVQLTQDIQRHRDAHDAEERARAHDATLAASKANRDVLLAEIPQVVAALDAQSQESNRKRREENEAERRAETCPDCLAKYENTCSCCSCALDPSKPHHDHRRRRRSKPTDTDVADVEGRAARAAQEGGSGIAGTVTPLQGAGLQAAALGDHTNPLLAELDQAERDLAAAITDPDDQAAAADEHAQREISAADDRAVADLDAGRLPGRRVQQRRGGANADPLDANATG